VENGFGWLGPLLTCREKGRNQRAGEGGVELPREGLNDLIQILLRFVSEGTETRKHRNGERKLGTVPIG